ncbi:MAG: ABC transporter ATP-binding protein [Eubacteriales bacterium]|nr:ABC transporter ATP-binding protein [Eubacteriales bacterium]
MSQPNFKQEKKIEKDADLSNLRKLAGYTKPWIKRLIFCFVLLIAVTASSLIQPYVIKKGLDDYLNPNRVSVEQVAKGDFSVAGKSYKLGKSNPKASQNFVERRNDESVISGEKASSDTSYIVLNWEGEEIRLTESEASAMWRGRYLELLKMVIFLAVVVIIGLAASYAQQYNLNFIGQKVIFAIRSDLFGHLQRLDLPFFERNPTGRLVTRMTNDLENINELYTDVIVSFLHDIGLVIGSIIMMLSMNPTLAAICLLVIPPLAIITYYFRKLVRQAYRVVRVRLARINTALNENITGMKTIQIFNQEDKFADDFAEINESYRQASRRELKLYAIFRPAINFLYYVALFLAVYFGGRMTMEGHLEVGVIIAMTLYIDKMFRPIQDLSEKFNILQASLTSVERIFLLFEESEEVINSPKPLAMPEEGLKGHVEFKDVHFSYIEGEEVLKGVSFEARPGDVIAFVGATGAGKSTIISLLSRLYDVDSGEILIDGHNIKEYDKYQLRRHISAVLQDVFLFSGDVRTNIKLLSPDITDTEIMAAARHVNADKIINRYPDGLDHPVTESGSTYSAGERQLISFARALVHKPDILILDEATASIDTDTEELIQEAIARLIEDRTTFIVAHRLSTIKNADKIIVMHHGQIAETGTHDELISLGGLYYDLYRLQYEDTQKM